MPSRRSAIVFLMAAGAYAACAMAPWHADVNIRRATGVVLATLILWISEIAPLGVTAMAIPIVATFAGLMPWKQAISAWGDEIIFLFLGAFLLARALEKHGVFDWVLSARWTMSGRNQGGMFLVLMILLTSGLLSTLQNNTAVTAMMLPVVLALTRRVHSRAAVLLALAWGSTFGGMATPVGTAPNFIGYAAMKQLDPGVNFFAWLHVGIPVWIGTSLIGWAVLTAASRYAVRHGVLQQSAGTDLPSPFPAETKAPAVDTTVSTPATRRIVIVLFVCAALLWLIPGMIRSALPAEHQTAIWIRTYLPESLVPALIAWLMFMIPSGVGRQRILDRHDFQSLDWDTLFLIAGGLSLGRMLETSGFADALAETISRAELPPLVLMLGVVACTVLLSELTSNTATASLMVPIASSLAAALSLSPVQAIWLVALAASLGFALPVSTPPNAIVYGTGLIPLRFMAVTGLIVDVLATIWLVCCVYFWA